MSLDVNISEPDEFNCTELHSSIEELAKLKGIDNVEYHVDYIYGRANNYIANIFRVLIKESGSSDSTSVVIKTLINTTRQKLFHELHRREVMVYAEVLPVFQSVQNDLVENKVIFPKHLFAKVDAGKEVLILEDLLATGFEVDDTLPKYEIPNVDQVGFIIKKLAKFHALSLVCEDKMIAEFHNLKLKLHDLIFQDDFLDKSNLRKYFHDSFKMTLKVIEHVDAKEKLQQIEPKIVEILKEYMSPQPRHVNVLCHGDFWINNMLFKYEDGKPTELCFIDFQAMRYTNPASDIVYFLYLCTDSNLRKSHFQDLIELYYEGLKEFLLSFNIDVEKVYVREEFDNDIKKYLPFGLAIALIELRIITPPIEDETDVKPYYESENYRPNDLFSIRVNDVVGEALENGVLDQLFEKLNS